MGSLFKFDPENMTQNDIVNIAQNADKLINIISKIKKNVAPNESH